MNSELNRFCKYFFYFFPNIINTPLRINRFPYSTKQRVFTQLVIAIKLFFIELSSLTFMFVSFIIKSSRQGYV